MRSSSLVAALVLACGIACSTPERDFAPDESTSATNASTGTDATTSTSGGSGAGGPGAGGAGSGGGPTTSGSPTTSTTGGGGGPPGCGDGNIDEGEDCDDDTTLCSGCAYSCPEGWFPSGDTCFAVSLAPFGGPRDALTADANCGSLAVTASGHRAHAATPASYDELLALASRCPDPGCWLGFYALGPPGEGVFMAPSTTEALAEPALWDDGEPSTDPPALCVAISTSAGEPVLDARPCTELGYVSCQLERTYGSFETCGNASVELGEECEGGEACDDCDRACDEGWIEDPSSHACFLLLKDSMDWASAEAACEDLGARLATPDDIADVRIAQVAGTGISIWIGLDASAPSGPQWLSGEAFDFEVGLYPLMDLPLEPTYGVVDGGGIVFDAAATAHPALCERNAPDD